MSDSEPTYSHCGIGDVDYLGPCSYPFECVTCGLRLDWADVYENAPIVVPPA